MLHINFKIFLIGLKIILLISPAYAEESTITLDFNDGTRISGIKYIRKKQPLSELTILGLTVGASNLNDVNIKLKGDSIYSEGDAGNNISILCFEGVDGTTIAFESNGEMGGPDRTVSYVGVFDKKTPYRLKDKCSVSKLISRRTKVGCISLGMSKQTLKRRRGQPSKELPNRIIYKYEVKERINNKLADVDSGLDVKFSNERLVYIGISKVASY